MEFKEFRALKSLPEAANGRHSRSARVPFMSQREVARVPSDIYRGYFTGSQVKLINIRSIPRPEILPKIREYLPDSKKTGAIHPAAKGVL